MMGHRAALPGWIRTILLAAMASTLIPACGSGGGTTIVTVVSTVSVSSIVASPAAVAPGAAVVLTGSATDTAGGTLTYAWSAAAGSLSAPTGNPVTWTAPLTVGSHLLQLTVTSSTGASSGGAASVLVSTNPSGSSVSLTSLSATPTAILPGGNALLAATATDSAGGTLTFNWSAASGSLSSPTGSSVTWTAPGVIGSYAVDLTVTSTSGGSAAGVVGVVVSNNPSGTAITFNSLSAAPPAVLPGGAATLTASATYGGPGTLSFSWSAASGSLSAATGNPVTWTAPAATGSYVVTVTVTDGLGASATGAVGILVAPNPTGAVITGVFPPEGRQGEQVVVTGSGFGATQAGSNITFNGVAGTVGSWSDTQIRATVPVTSSGPLLVQLPGGPSSSFFFVVDWTKRDPQNVPVTAAGQVFVTPRCVSDAAGGSIVVHTDGLDILAQRVDATGTPLWGTGGVVVCGVDGKQVAPEICADGAGGAIVVWTDRRPGANGLIDLYAQRLNALGVPQWTATGVPVCTATGAETNYRLVPDGAGGMFLVWNDTRGGGNVFAQRIDSTGTALWLADGIQVGTGGSFPQIIRDGGTGCIVAWKVGTTALRALRLDAAGLPLWAPAGVPVISGLSGTVNEFDLGADGAGGGVFAWEAPSTTLRVQRIDPAGALLWAPGGVAVSTSLASAGVPRVVSDGGGGLITLWAQVVGPYGRLFAQRVDSAGVLQWAAGGVQVANGSFTQDNTRLLADGSGGVFITWDDGGISVGFDVHAQRLNSAGVPQWSVEGVLVSDADSWQFISIPVLDGAGGIILVWEDYREGPPSSYGQRLDGSGVAQWASNGLLILGPSLMHWNPQAATDGDQGAILVWQDRRNLTTDLFAQRVTKAGATAWPTNGRPVCLAAGDQLRPQIVSDGAGGAIVAWEDPRSGVRDLYAQRLDPTGAPLWTVDGIAVCSAIGEQRNLRMIPDGAGGAILVWEDGRSGAADLYVQRLDASGNALWTPDGVALCTAAGVQSDPAIVSDGADGAIVAWADFRGGATSDIYVRRVDGSGVPQGTPDGTAVCSAVGDQSLPKIITDGAGGAILAWEDHRTATPDLFARRVDSTGAMLWAVDGVQASGAAGPRSQITLVPNGAGGAFVACQAGTTVKRIVPSVLSASGVRTNFSALSVGTTHQRNPQMVPDGTGGGIVTWMEDRGTGYDVFTQRVGFNGATKWTTSGVEVCTATGNQTLPFVLADGIGGVIIGWTAYDFTAPAPFTGLAGIYVQGVSSAGIQ